MAKGIFQLQWLNPGKIIYEMSLNGNSKFYLCNPFAALMADRGCSVARLSRGALAPRSEKSNLAVGRRKSRGVA